MHDNISQNLNIILMERNITATELAVGARVSNATISKLRQKDYAGSVSFNVILKICQFLDVPLDYFAPPGFNKKPQTSLTFHDSALEGGAFIYDEFMKRSLSGESLYISNTIPDALKTAAVMTAELGERTYIPNYAAKMKQIRDSDAVVKSISGAFFIDELMLVDLINSRGTYAELTAAEVSEQVDILHSLFEAAFPRVHGYVVDFRRNDLSTCFVVDQRFGAQFVFGGYFEWDSPRLGQIVHKKAMRAALNATSITQFLKSHLKSVGG